MSRLLLTPPSAVDRVAVYSVCSGVSGTTDVDCLRSAGNWLG